MSERRSLIGGLLIALSFAAGTLSAAAIIGQASPVLAQTVSAERPKKDPVDARKDVINGVKAFEKGKMEEAIELLTKGLKSGGLASADTAKALYYRGLANRRSGKPAQAISDLTSSLWLKEGLSEAERKTAIENRSGAYAEAGLKDPGMDVIAGSEEESGASRVASKPSSASSSYSSSSSSSSSSSGSSGGALSGVGNFFSSLFGGGSSSSANASTAETEPAAEGEAVEAAPAPAASVSAWNSATEVAPAKASGRQWETSARPASQAAARPAAEPATAAQGKVQKKGRFEVHVAAVRSREEAERLAQEVTQKHAGLLGTRAAEIEETVFGNMGTFYRVSIGPFAKADETAGVCKALIAGGYDCMVAKN